LIYILTAHEEISELKDYEDAVIDELALNEEIDYIVTRNLKDFKKSRNKIYSAREIFASQLPPNSLNYL